MEPDLMPADADIQERLHTLIDHLNSAELQALWRVLQAMATPPATDPRES